MDSDIWFIFFTHDFPVFFKILNVHYGSETDIFDIYLMLSSGLYLLRKYITGGILDVGLAEWSGIKYCSCYGSEFSINV